MVDEEQLKRWRLILGSSAGEPLEALSAGGLSLDPEEVLMDEALAAIYDRTEPGGAAAGGGGQAGRRSAGLGPSSPRLAKWLADIRTCFSEDVVSVIQSDAIERKGLTQLLFEPEVLKNVQPDMEMVATLMSTIAEGLGIPSPPKESGRSRSLRHHSERNSLGQPIDQLKSND